MSPENVGDPGAFQHGQPRLERVENLGIVVHTDPDLLERGSIRVAFTERAGGSSRPPYDALNLAAHVGDEPSSVDANRVRLLESLGLASDATRLTTAEQVHGTSVHTVTPADAGAGASALGRPPIAGTDALVTTEQDVPLLMLYADCVPIVLVAEKPTRGVAVVHSGWKGTLAEVVSRAAERLVDSTGSAPDELLGYVGPHIGSCCYNVDARLISQFSNRFDTITAVDDRLDLEAAVIESMQRAGMRRDNIATAALCTQDHTDRFFSYRAHRVTGRHGALAVIGEVE